MTVDACSNKGFLRLMGKCHSSRRHARVWSNIYIVVQVGTLRYICDVTRVYEYRDKKSPFFETSTQKIVSSACTV